MNEEWRSILGGEYEVSSHGKVRRLTQKQGAVPGRILKHGIGPRGYPAVVVGGGGERRRTRNIHDLVAAAFIGPKPDGNCVNHIDGDKTNNHASNLEYVTQAENMRHASETGLLSVGENRKTTKLTKDMVLEIRRQRELGVSLSVLGRRFGVNGVTVFDASSGRTWRHV